MSSKFLQKFQEKITVVGRDGSTQPVCLVGVPSSPKRHLRFPDNNHAGSAGASVQSRSSASEYSFGHNTVEEAAENRRPFPPQISRPSGDDAGSGVSNSSSSRNPNRKLTVRDLRRYSESAYVQPASSQSQTSTIRPSPRAQVAADNYFDALLSQPLPLRQAQTAHPSAGQREYAAAAAANRARESVSQAKSLSHQYPPRKDLSSQRSLSIPRGRVLPANAHLIQPAANPQLSGEDSFLNRIAFSRKAPENVEFKPYLQPFKKGEYFELGTLGPDLMDAEKVLPFQPCAKLFALAFTYKQVLARQNRERILQYARQLRDMNAEKIPFPDKRPPPPLQSSFGTKPESTRQKALESRARVMEFASTVPKPFSKLKREVSFSNEPIDASCKVLSIKPSVFFLLLHTIKLLIFVAGTYRTGNSGCQTHAQSCSRLRNTQPAGHLINYFSLLYHNAFKWLL